MEAITYNEAMLALKAWHTFEQLEYNVATVRKFEQFLGFPIFTSTSDMYPIGVPEEVAKKIRWLLGPHAHTLFKAWKAQRENREF